MKRALKKTLIKKQENICILSGEKLSEDLSLFDTDRKIPKKDGGIYLVSNTRAVSPVAHMKRHGSFRERQEELSELKIMIDGRNQLQKTLNGINNRILAMKRGTDDLDESTVIMLGEQLDLAKNHKNEVDRRVNKFVRGMDNPLAQAALQLKGIGEITVAYCLSYIDLTKARHASSLWAYAGLHKSATDRYKKEIDREGKEKINPGNKTLRTALYNMAESQKKLRGPYREVYDRVKERLSVSDKIIRSNNTQGKEIECVWKDVKPCHREGAALRAIMKHFLADYWFVGRTLLGLPTDPLYAEAILQGGHKTIAPEERGWKY